MRLSTLFQSPGIMTDIFRKFRGKFRTSSQLDSRWGDASISYPNEGSWSQYDQPSGFNVASTEPKAPSEQGKRHGSLDSLDQRGHPSHAIARPSPSISVDDRAASAHSASTIPTGHYDANLRRRPTRRQRSQTQPSGPGLGIGIGMLQNGCNAWEDSSSDGASSDDEANSFPSSPSSTGGGRRTTGRYLSVNTEEADYSRAAKSPPLSVTSRMRPYSYEPSTSASGTASSRHTSFTSSVPSASPEDLSRLGYNRHYHLSHQEKKRARCPQPLELEPLAQDQELVPSYDELYG